VFLFLFYGAQEERVERINKWQEEKKRSGVG